MAKKSTKAEATENPVSGSESGTVSKAEAIRRAIADGYDSPDKGTDYIKSTFGIEVSKAHFSANKSKLKSQDGSKSVTTTVKVKRGRKPRIEGLVAPPAKAISGSEGDLLAAMEAIKPLVASMGADKVKRLVDLLA